MEEGKVASPRGASTSDGSVTVPVRDSMEDYEMVKRIGECCDGACLPA